MHINKGNSLLNKVTAKLECKCRQFTNFSKSVSIPVSLEKDL